MVKKLLAATSVLVLIIAVGIGAYIFFTQETEQLTDGVREELPGSFVRLSKGTVHYELKGPKEGKRVILIHGAGSGYYAWDNNYEALVKEGFQVLRYDLYGRGFSDRPEVVYDSVLLYQQLKELVQALRIEPPYSIIAVSMGATVGIHYTAKHLVEVEQLILVDPAALSDGSLAWYLKNPVLSPLLMSLYWYPRAVEKQMREYYGPRSVPEYREKSWEQLKYKGLKRAMLSTWQHTLTLNMSPQLREIGRSKVEVLLVWGKYDPLIPPAASQSYKEMVPLAHYVEIDSAGHLSNYEKPSVFNNLISKFLKNEK